MIRVSDDSNRQIVAREQSRQSPHLPLSLFAIDELIGACAEK